MKSAAYGSLSLRAYVYASKIATTPKSARLFRY